MRYITGTSGGGKIQSTRPNTKVLSIEFHAQAANSGRVVVGDSTVSLTDGMGIEPDDRHAPDFLGSDGVQRSVNLSELFTAVSGSDKVDWAAQVEP